MDEIKSRLISLFDETLACTGKFKKKTYAGIYETARAKYEDIPLQIAELCAQAPEGEKQARINEIAAVLPDHAQERIKAAGRMKRNGLAMDFNVNMAVYVLPVLNHTKNGDCTAVTDQIVKLWNERDVTSLKLSNSTYEKIAAGFRNKILGIPIPERE